jgi:nucleotide-binding universal stress UspA family protein
MDQRILVPYDSSELGTLALKRAFEEHPNADVTVLHVIDTLAIDQPHNWCITLLEKDTG